eukprot:1650017-Amphidinium_carterae.1
MTKRVTQVGAQHAKRNSLGAVAAKDPCKRKIVPGLKPAKLSNHQSTLDGAPALADTSHLVSPILFCVPLAEVKHIRLLASC